MDVCEVLGKDFISMDFEMNVNVLNIGLVDGNKSMVMVHGNEQSGGLSAMVPAGMASFL